MDALGTDDKFDVKDILRIYSKKGFSNLYGVKKRTVSSVIQNWETTSRSNKPQTVNAAVMLRRPQVRTVCRAPVVYQNLADSTFMQACKQPLLSTAS